MTDRDDAGWSAAREARRLSGCKKKQVGAAIVSGSGELLAVGWNDANCPLPNCPRLYYDTGQGYAMCRDICNQQFHAEERAIENMKNEWSSAPDFCTMYVFGHDVVCAKCDTAARRYGIASIEVKDV